MMMNLFSTFDPCTGMLSLNWLSTIIIMMLLNYKYWLINNNFINLLMNIMNKIQQELFMTMPYKGSTLLFMSLFMLILANNLMGLLPYVFTSSSSLTFSLAMALPSWITFMIYGWLNKTNKMFSHLVPIGTPSILMAFMIIIETISNIIRPGSLAVRLSANMIAGHLLMSLLGSSMNFTLTTMFMFLFISLMLFETAVSLIQSYVFMTLMSLYSSEI